MCAFNQKGDLFKGCRFLSRKPYSLLKRKERKLRCIPGKFWFSRAILVYTVWTPRHLQPVVTNEVTWTVISVWISLSYCFHLHISGPLESLPQSVTKLYRRNYVYSYTVSHLCWQAIFSYSSISGLCQYLFPKRTLKMSLYCCHCCYTILWDHDILLRIISSCVLQSSKSCEEPR